jgi:hypothetical protein
MEGKAAAAWQAHWRDATVAAEERGEVGGGGSGWGPRDVGWETTCVVLWDEGAATDLA